MTASRDVNASSPRNSDYPFRPKTPKARDALEGVRWVAEAIRDALQMSHEERVTRWQGMIGPLQS